MVYGHISSRFEIRGIDALDGIGACQIARLVRIEDGGETVQSFIHAAIS